jgi:hypothetical protein
VTALRHFFRTHVQIAALVVALALVLRILVPAGFMPVMDSGSLTITLCDGYGPAKMTVSVPGLHHHDAGQMQQRCAFADLAVPAIGGADPVQLAAALAFILLAAIFAVPVCDLRRARHLRPPLRGPPLPR